MKKAFITGGNRGIGLQTAKQMGKLGYQVIISSRDAEKGKAAVMSLLDSGISNASFVVMDVLDDKSVENAATEVRNRCNGVLDVLINNAGIATPYINGDIVNLEYMHKCLESNTIAPMRVTNNFLQMIKKSSSGRIVNLSSIMGSIQGHPQNGIDSCAYNVSKAALNMYTKCLASALAKTNIKVNSAHPGWVKTDMGGPNAPLELSEGAETTVYLATLPDNGPTGGFFYKRERLPW